MKGCPEISSNKIGFLKCKANLPAVAYYPAAVHLREAASQRIPKVHATIIDWCELNPCAVLIPRSNSYTFAGCRDELQQRICSVTVGCVVCGFVSVGRNRWLKRSHHYHLVRRRRPRGNSSAIPVRHCRISKRVPAVMATRSRSVGLHRKPSASACLGTWRKHSG